MRIIVTIVILAAIVGVGAYTTGWFGTPETPETPEATETESN